MVCGGRDVSYARLIKNILSFNRVIVLLTYCADKCEEYKAHKPAGKSRYATGQKRCNYCDIFLAYNGLNCPCYNRQLRCQPRSKKGKELVAAQSTQLHPFP